MIEVMSELFQVKLIQDERGGLGVLEEELPFEVRRVFYIYDVPRMTSRGGHRHLKNRMILICLSGSCEIDLDNGKEKKTILLDSPGKGLLVEPQDFHIMKSFTEYATLLVLASEKYDPSDYIYEAYE